MTVDLPRYACVAANSRGDAIALASHEQGQLLGVTRKGRLFACRRCGLVYWQPFRTTEQAEDGRCHGVTTKGQRCKLAACRDSDYCGNHAYLEAQTRLIMADAIDGTDG